MKRIKPDLNKTKTELFVSKIKQQQKKEKKGIQMNLTTSFEAFSQPKIIIKILFTLSFMPRQHKDDANETSQVIYGGNVLGRVCFFDVQSFMETIKRRKGWRVFREQAEKKHLFHLNALQCVLYSST